MEIKRRKEMSLGTFFLRFLAHTIMSVLLVCLLWFVLLELAVAFHIILPANFMEREIRSFSEEIKHDTHVTSEQIPNGAGFAIYDKNYNLSETNLSDNLLEDAAYLAASKQESLGADFSGRVYIKQETDTQILILSYRIRSILKNPTLRRLCPDVEVLELAVLLLLLLADLVFVITRNARKLTKELRLLQHATDQIRQQNLDFIVPTTHIRELNQVAESLEALKTGLSASLKEQWHMQQQKKRQLSALAHDIKTPLTIVKGNAELLAETNLDEEQTTYNQFVLKNAEQIQFYVSKMIETAKTMASDSDTSLVNKSSVEASSVLFRPFLDELLEDTKSLGQKKNITVLFSYENLPEFLPFPADSIKRILTNLLDNAVQYSPYGGTVTMHAKIDTSTSSDRMIVYTVSDEGCGFSEEALRLGTEEFYRAEVCRNDHEHFGLGLFIAKQLVTGLNGTLCLNNRPEGGAVVTVTFSY